MNVHSSTSSLNANSGRSQWKRQYIVTWCNTYAAACAMPKDVWPGRRILVHFPMSDNPFPCWKKRSVRSLETTFWDEWHIIYDRSGFRFEISLLLFRITWRRDAKSIIIGRPERLFEWRLGYSTFYDILCSNIGLTYIKKPCPLLRKSLPNFFALSPNIT